MSTFRSLPHYDTSEEALLAEIEKEFELWSPSVHQTVINFMHMLCWFFKILDEIWFLSVHHPIYFKACQDYRYSLNILRIYSLFRIKEHCTWNTYGKRFWIAIVIRPSIKSHRLCVVSKYFGVVNIALYMFFVCSSKHIDFKDFVKPVLCLPRLMLIAPGYCVVITY